MPANICMDAPPADGFPNVIINMVVMGIAPVPVPIPEAGMSPPAMMVPMLPDILVGGTSVANLVTIFTLTPMSGPCGPAPLMGLLSGMLVALLKILMGIVNVLFNGAPVAVSAISMSLGNLINVMMIQPGGPMFNVEIS